MLNFILPILIIKLVKKINNELNQDKISIKKKHEKNYCFFFLFYLFKKDHLCENSLGNIYKRIIKLIEFISHCIISFFKFLI